MNSESMLNSELVRFAQAVGSDSVFRGELKALGTTEQEAVVRFANSKGFNFSLEDIPAAPAATGELSESQLELVTGGAIDGLLVLGAGGGYVLIGHTTPRAPGPGDSTSVFVLLAL